MKLNEEQRKVLEEHGHPEDWFIYPAEERVTLECDHCDEVLLVLTEDATVVEQERPALTPGTAIRASPPIGADAMSGAIADAEKHGAAAKQAEIMTWLLSEGVRLVAESGDPFNRTAREFHLYIRGNGLMDAAHALTGKLPSL